MILNQISPITKIGRAEQLITWSRSIRQLLNETHEFIHPETSTIKGLSYISGQANRLTQTPQLVMLFLWRQSNRPLSLWCSGTSARMAQWYAKGLLKPEINSSMKALLSNLFGAFDRRRNQR
ncbi:MAG: proline racemase family protein [Saprospiraceae bacterium]